MTSAADVIFQTNESLVYDMSLSTKIYAVVYIVSYAGY